LIRQVEAVGADIIRRVEDVGGLCRLAVMAIYQLVRPPWRFGLAFKQMEFIGVQSLSIVIITGVFTGAVFALQAHYGFSFFGAETLTGSTVALSLTRELGPALTAVMVTGRAGSAIAAELGTMKVTEQIDALEAMAVDPVDYLVAPRLLAGTVMLPMLAMVFNGVGVVGAYIVGIYVLDIPRGAFIYRIEWYLDPDDVTGGLAKAAVFGFMLALIGAYKGLAVRGGAEGVGRATTEAVVMASVSILIVDYFLTAWWMT